MHVFLINERKNLYFLEKYKRQVSEKGYNKMSNIQDSMEKLEFERKEFQAVFDEKKASADSLSQMLALLKQKLEAEKE